MSIPPDLMKERARMHKHLASMEPHDQVLLIMSWMGLQRMREFNDFIDKITEGTSES